MSNKANDENITSGSVPKLHVSSDRTALGQLSPNRQSSTLLNTSHEEQTKLLKRSIINPIDASRGFQYLKRRRLSSSIGQPPQRTSNEISNAQRTDLRILERPKDNTHESDRPHLERHSSSDRQSFSSLINFEPSSQTGMSSQQPAAQTTISDQQQTEPSAANDRVELLRLRLRMAMYKVETNQVGVPFDYLREDSSTGSKESHRAVAEAVEQLRIEARRKLEQQLKAGTATQRDEDPVQLTSKVHDATLNALKDNENEVKGEVAVGLLGLKTSV